MTLTTTFLAVTTVLLTAVNLVPAETLPASPGAEQVTVPADEYFAAIAYSPESGNWGFCYGYDSALNAEMIAQAYVEGGCCPARISVKDQYVALAVGDDLCGCGWGTGSTAEAARQQALAHCQKQTTGAHVVVCVHAKYGRL